MEMFPNVDKIYWHDRVLNRLVVRFLPNWIKPNHITRLRFVLTPIVVWLIWNDNFVWGMPLFVLASLTDAIDGTMARMRHQITRWGIVFDPIADKLLVGSVLVVLIIRHLSFYLGIAIIAVEAIVALAGIYSHRKDTVYMANYIGKAKMCLQVFGIGFLLLGSWIWNAALQDVATVILAVSLIFAVANIVAFGLRRAI